MSVAGSVVDELDAVVDRLAEVDPAKLCDRETVVRCTASSSAFRP